MCLDLHSRAIVCRIWVGRARADASRIRYESRLLHELCHKGDGNDLVIRHRADRAGDRARAATAALHGRGRDQLSLDWNDIFHAHTLRRGRTFICHGESIVDRRFIGAQGSSLHNLDIGADRRVGGRVGCIARAGANVVSLRPTIRPRLELIPHPVQVLRGRRTDSVVGVDDHSVNKGRRTINAVDIQLET